MSLLITFWNGNYTQFDECNSIEHDLGLFRIYQNHECYEYEKDGIKEIIIVNDYTRTYAINQGYEQ